MLSIVSVARTDAADRTTVAMSIKNFILILFESGAYDTGDIVGSRSSEHRDACMIAHFIELSLREVVCQTIIVKNIGEK